MYLFIIEHNRRFELLNDFFKYNFLSNNIKNLRILYINTKL